MNQFEFITFIKNQIKDIPFVNMNSEPERIFEYILKKSFNELLLTNIKIDDKYKNNVTDILTLRRSGMPLAYIFGYEYFFNYKFIVNQHTLIPRHDSEILVQKAIELSKNGDKLLDLCCGSGCLGISIAKNVNLSELILLDINENALNVAKQNSINLNIKSDIIQNDVFNVNFIAKLIENVDIMVSNPPYISKIEYNLLEPQVKDFEPKIALTDNGNGLAFYEAIFKAIQIADKKPKFLFLEIGCNQSNQIINIFNEKYQIIKDFANRDRVCILFFNQKVVI